MKKGFGFTPIYFLLTGVFALALFLGDILAPFPAPRYQNPRGVLNLSVLYEKNLSGKGVTIAVIDEGFDPTHAHLQGRFAENPFLKPGERIQESVVYDKQKKAYVFDNHGTHVSGLIIGKESGIAPQSSIIPLVLEPATGRDHDFVRLLRQGGTSPARIINLSLMLSYSHRLSLNVAQALKELIAQNKLVVIAAGNDGVNLYHTLYGQALMQLAMQKDVYGGLIIVGACSLSNLRRWQRAPFSNWVPFSSFETPFVLAPGHDILSTLPGNITGSLSGTSMATPLVVGVAALLMEAFPHHHARDIGRLIILGRNPLGIVDGARSLAIGESLQP